MSNGREIATQVRSSIYYALNEYFERFGSELVEVFCGSTQRFQAIASKESDHLPTNLLIVYYDFYKSSLLLFLSSSTYPLYVSLSESLCLIFVYSKLWPLLEKYTNLFEIDLSIVSRLHRENILNTLITITEYLPISRSKKACFTI